EDAIDFLEDNHIEGPLNVGIRIGLYYNNELVSLMCLTKSKGPKVNERNYQLLRFCNRIDLSINNSEQILFDYFLTKYEVNSVISKIDRSKSTGEMEEKLGFI